MEPNSLEWRIFIIFGFDNLIRQMKIVKLWLNNHAAS